MTYRKLRAVVQHPSLQRHVPALALASVLGALAPAAAAWAQAAADSPSAPAATPADSAAAAKPSAESSTQLQDIVITATRHSELLSKVPISVSAFTQETLDMKGIKDVSDVVRFTPGIAIDLDGTNNISIRGIASGAGASTTGIYIDDTPIQLRVLGFDSDNALPKTFDLDRVEVLRGPQGTLFGAGAEGGAVRYIMTQPNMHQADGYARSELAFTQGGAPSYEAGIAAGTPLVDNVLGVRGSIWYRHDGGWIDRLDPFTFQTVQNHANFVDTVAARVAAKWAVNDALTVTPSVMYQDRRQNDVSTYFPTLSNPGSDQYRNAWATPRYEPDLYVLPALKVETELGPVSFTSNTSYFTRRDLSGYDGTMYNLSLYQQFQNPGNTTLYLPLAPAASALCGGPGCYYTMVDASGLHLPAALQGYRAPARSTNQQQTFAQEFRFQNSDPKAALSWTAGLFYSKSNQTNVEEIRDPGIAQFFQTIYGVDYNTAVFGEALLPNGDNYYNRNSAHDRQVAIFGEASYAVTDRLKATLGLRYSKNDSAFDHFADGPQNFGPTPLTGGTESDKPFTPKASLAYQADRDNLYYATYAKGYRVGGGNAPVPQLACVTALAQVGLSQAPSSYASDSVNSFEVGAKNKIGDTLRVASSLYYIKWKGIQQNIYLSCGFQFVANLSEAVAKGGDIQLEWAPNSSLSFDVAIGRTEAHNTADVGGNAASGTLPLAAKGDAIEGITYGPAPPWTLSLGAQYDFTAMDHKSFVRLDYEFSKRSGNLTPTEDPRTSVYDPYIYTPASSGFVSVRAGTTAGRWSISAFVDNLLDVHPQALDTADYHSGVDPFNPNPSTVLTTAYTYRPRTMGVTGTVRF